MCIFGGVVGGIVVLCRVWVLGIFGFVFLWCRPSQGK